MATCFVLKMVVGHTYPFAYDPYFLLIVSLPYQHQHGHSPCALDTKRQNNIFLSYVFSLLCILMLLNLFFYSLLHCWCEIFNHPIRYRIYKRRVLYVFNFGYMNFLDHNSPLDNKLNIIVRKCMKHKYDSYNSTLLRVEFCL